MAYRKLEFGDHVRVVGGSNYSGRNAVVIDEDKNLNKVQLSDKGNTVTLWVASKNLLVRNDEFDFILDGKIDHDKKNKYEQEKKRSYKNRGLIEMEHEFLDDEEEFEPCGTCPCCEAHNR